MVKRLSLLLCITAWFSATSAHAVMNIEITGGQEGASPIAIVPFGYDGGTPPTDIAAVIGADIRRTGRFSPLAERDLIARPRDMAEVNFADWRSLGSENLVVGRVRPAGGGYTVQFELFDVFKGARMAGYSFTVRESELRRVAHRIADIIYERLTGERGAFDTRIAYVLATPARGKHTTYTLQVADSDGYNPATILSARDPILSPAWSPDGTRLAYVFFENRRPQVYVQDLRSGSRQSVAAYPGTNSAPAWSPDGRRLAVTLSRDGNPEIYIIDLSTRETRRLTNNTAIDTEPAWSPDGATIAFTSDRGGSPQVYRMSAQGGGERRVTFEGSYNARPRFSPDGKRLALVHGSGSTNHIAILELDSGALQVLTRTSLDESPSFAPNGSMILYGSEDQGREVLAAVAANGRAQQRLGVQDGDLREPAWGPFNKKIDD